MVLGSIFFSTGTRLIGMWRDGDKSLGHVPVDIDAMAERIGKATGTDAAEVRPLVWTLVLEADIRVGTPAGTVEFILQGIEKSAARRLNFAKPRPRKDVALPGVGLPLDEHTRAMMWMTGSRPVKVQRRGAVSKTSTASVVPEPSPRLGRRDEDKSATVGLVPFLR